MLLPVVLMTAGCAMFGPVCMRFCLPACVVAGCAIGAVVAIRARRQEHDALEFLAAGVSVAALTASLGCTLAGAAGVLGMAVGTIVAGTPVWLTARADR